MPRSKHADYASIVVAGLAVAIGPLAVAQPARCQPIEGRATAPLESHLTRTTSRLPMMTEMCCGSTEPDNPTLIHRHLISTAFSRLHQRRRGGFKEADIEGAARIG